MENIVLIHSNQGCGVYIVQKKRKKKKKGWGVYGLAINTVYSSLKAKI
jgi:hypothetical protein